MKVYRLIKLAKKFGRGTKEIVEVLAKHGFIVVDKPIAKITEEMYQILVQEFGDDNVEELV